MKLIHGAAVTRNGPVRGEKKKLGETDSLRKGETQ